MTLDRFIFNQLILMKTAYFYDILVILAIIYVFKSALGIDLSIKFHLQDILIRPIEVFENFLYGT